ncbi:MAG: HAMP domain-containing protein [Acidimicrobiales bacterium]
MSRLSEWWNRPRQLKRVLAAALVLATLASVLLVGVLNWVAARRLLDEGTQEQLVSAGESQARSLEAGVEILLAQVAAASADLAVADALQRFEDTFAELDDEALTAGQQAELDAFYQDEVVGPINAAGLGPVSVEDIEPPEAGAYLQYHYTANIGADERSAVLDPGDGSTYTEAHVEAHPFLSDLVESMIVEDLLLVSDGGTVVYSNQKRIDLGVELGDELRRDSELAGTVLDELPVRPLGQGVTGDYSIYFPADGRPVAFAAAAVRSGTEVIGSLVVAVPAESLSALTTADGEWEAAGLGDGESYVVAASGRTLQSESRLWLEDPDAYLDKVDETTAQLVELFGSPVGVQSVDTEPVNEAIGGRVFEGEARNYLGQKTYTYATPIDIEGTAWVSVAEVSLSDARSPLFDYAKRLGLVMLITVPLAALIGIWLAGRLTRPIPPLVSAARAVADGERHPDVADLGNDEFGDLARRLGVMARQLEQQETELAEEFESTRKLLLTVLPPRIIDSDGGVSTDGDAIDIVTVISVGVDLAEDGVDHADVLGQVADATEELAHSGSMERVRSAADRFLVLAGQGIDADGADEALGFARELVNRIRAISATEGVEVSIHIGMSTGPVATGVLQRGSLTFAAWGEPVRRALAIGALSRSDEVLVDAPTMSLAADPSWDLRPAQDVVALDGEAMTLYVLADGDTERV